MAVEIRGNMAFRQTDIDKALEEGVKGIVEYRSPLAGEDMPRKPLDSLGERSHCWQWVGLACSTPPTASRRVRGLGQSPRGVKGAMLAAIMARICTAANNRRSSARRKWRRACSFSPSAHRVPLSGIAPANRQCQVRRNHPVASRR